MSVLPNKEILRVNPGLITYQYLEADTVVYEMSWV